MGSRKLTDTQILYIQSIEKFERGQRSEICALLGIQLCTLDYWWKKRKHGLPSKRGKLYG
jgi:hypothetical protein